jgi:hypothetical protein
MLACELSASIFCASVLRGIISMLTALTPASASERTSACS